MKHEDLKGRWVDEVPEVLWAYRTTARSTTSENPISVAYGYKAMVLIEIGAGSIRREITTQSKTRPYKGMSSILLKRNDVTLNLELRHISSIQLDISTRR